MDVLARLRPPDSTWLRGRRARLLRCWLAVALLLAGGLLLLHPGSARGAPAVPAVVAARDLPSGAALRPSDVRLAALPDSARPAGVFTEPGAVVGRLLAGAVRSGEPLTDVRVAANLPGSGDPASATVPVRLADAAVADLLRPGQPVDVVAAPEPGGAPSVLASGATVVTVGRPDPGPAKPATPVDRGPLVLLSLPKAVAAQVAAISLERPVTVTLR